MATAPPATLAARIGRVRRHLESADLDALVVTHPPNLFYLTGLRATSGALVLTRRQVVLVADPRYVQSAREVVARLATETRTRLHEAPRSLDEAVVQVLQKTRAGRSRRRGRGRASRVGVEGATLPVSRFQRLAAALRAPRSARARAADVELVATDGLIEQERAVKGDVEIAVIRQAAGRLDEVARWVPALLRPGRTERDIAADIDDAMRRAGFERPAFETIVASGPHSALPHARPTDRRLAPGDAVVLDFGGVYEGYCVDLSRTACLGGPSDELARMHAAVLDAQDAALATLRPGVRASAVDAAARRVLDGAGLGAAFLHGTGHGLGLEVHEVPRLGRAEDNRADPVLQAGMVVTVEPGAYVAGVGGVRIEDDVLVTPVGGEVLTGAPRGLWVIE